ncbi:MAG: YggT family protein [Pseudomonadota bacterium]|nr:YggT family protein [Pseudomonadota bacterium]
MLFQVLTFLMDVAVTLVGGACLLRLYMRWRRMPMGHPVGRFVQALSDWLVLPLQRLVPSTTPFDLASLLAAWLLKSLQLAALMGLMGVARWVLLPLLALLGVAKLAVSVATAVIIIAAVLSWTGNRTPVSDMFDRLSAPLLAPVRRLIRPVGGVDLSPLLLIVGLQVVGIVLGSLQNQLFGAGLPMLGA